MRAPIWLLCVLLCACATSSSLNTAGTPATTTSTTRATTVVPTTTAPSATPTLILSHEDIEGANHLLVGAVTADQGVVHAYVVAFDDNGQRIVHLEWPVGTEDIAQDPSNIERLGFEFDRPGPIPTSLLATNDGWRLYGQGLPLDDPTARVFWAVSAEDPGGPWERTPGVVMRDGDPGDWDGDWIDFPSVIGDGDDYLMAYQGATSGFTSDIGVATSGDGVEWVKPDEPQITAAECQAESLAMPRLFTDSSGMSLAHLQFPEDGDDPIIALDTAAGYDGLGCGEVVLTRSDLPASGGIHSFGMFPGSDGLWLLVESLSLDSGSSDLWLIPLGSGHWHSPRP